MVYSFSELCRFILTYYLFDNENIDGDIADYMKTAIEKERAHYEDYYDTQPMIVKAVYTRLCREMNRRQRVGLHDLDKFYTNIYATVEKITRRLNVSVEEFLTQRFYPYVAKWRNKRLRQFYKAYTGKNLPE